MKILVIDSHKSTNNNPQQNLHWLNAKTIADHLGADLIWSYIGVNDNIKTGYDAIIFVHASNYSFVDKAWLTLNPEAKLFYITNEYNLGEPSILWSVAKAGRKYNVIANHMPEASKVVTKYTEGWWHMNLNALCVRESVYEKPNRVRFGSTRLNDCVYYGSFRKDRTPYFKKYLTNSPVVLSTHQKNEQKYRDLGCDSRIIPRLDWSGNGFNLSEFKYSLYIEDVKTHTHYNCLANRFYEAINYGVTPLFDVSCRGTLEEMSSQYYPYDIDERLIVDGTSDIIDILGNPPSKVPLLDWHSTALLEKASVLGMIETIVDGVCNG